MKKNLSLCDVFYIQNAVAAISGYPIYINKASTCGMRFTTTKLTQVISIASFLCWIVYGISIMYSCGISISYSNNGDILRYAQYYLHTLTSFVNMFSMFYYRKDYNNILNILCDIDDILKDMKDVNAGTVRRCIFIFIAHVIIVLVLFSTEVYIVYEIYTKLDYCLSAIYTGALQILNTEACAIFILIEINKRFANLCSAIDVHENGDEMEMIKILFFRLCRSSKVANDMFMLQSLNLIFYQFSFLCMSAFSYVGIMVNKVYNFRQNIALHFFVFSWVLYRIYSLVILIWSFDKLKHTIDTVRKKLNDYERKINYKNYLVFNWQLNLQDVNFHIFELIPFDYSIIFMILSGITTYIVILYQMNPRNKGTLITIL